MNKIAIVTATRAEYGLLKPVIRRVSNDKNLQLDLIVTGTHLSKKYGHTVDEIIEDGFPISHKIPILEKENRPIDISVSVANAIKGFANCFLEDRPDLLLILGDRTEMLGVAIPAVNEHIPIAHIHGGEVTEGAVDDCVRHSLTKMSYLHFTSTETYRKRVIQLGEDPSRVFNVGALSTENILKENLLSEENLRRDLNIPENSKYAVVTFHPVTEEDNSSLHQVGALCEAMEENDDIFYEITMANSDTGSDFINDKFLEFSKSHDNANMVASLGMKRYLSAIKYASFVLGNSSSGIIEAPVLGTPTVNIGDRQKGRIMVDTIINCRPIKEDISGAIRKAMRIPHFSSNIYGNGNTSEKIVEIVKDYLMNDKIYLKKKFYDIKN